MKNAEFVSRITNDLNALTKDVHLSKRWILNIGQTKAESYVPSIGMREACGMTIAFLLVFPASR